MKYDSLLSGGGWVGVQCIHSDPKKQKKEAEKLPLLVWMEEVHIQGIW